jgi:DNA-binding beta-propeller fold protein YncE
MCEWVPASAAAPASFFQGQGAPSGTAAGAEIEREPVRIIRDTYATYSAIALDLNTNEVYLQDENLFGVKVFNRLDNTPANASFTEPKRVLGGLETKLEFNCGLYLDPVSGDMYSVNNDTVDTMVVFPRNAQGNVKPTRELETPHRTYGIAVDEQAQELYLAVQYPPEVVVYRKMASGTEEPIRRVAGGRTQLEDAHGIALDTKNGLMFVSNHGSDSNYEVPGSGKFHPPSITVYPLKANGDVAPLRIIEGPKTRLNWPAAMGVDPERGELYVANDSEDSILVFRATDNGDVAPTRMIRGPKTGLKNPTGIFVDTKNRELWASNMGNHRATVYALDANGDVPPLRTIRSAPADKPALAIGNPGAVGYDSKRDEILVPN